MKFLGLLCVLVSAVCAVDLGGKVIGMVHVLALPGSPRYNEQKGIEHIVAVAVEETKTYLKGGVDAIMIENMHDVPYVRAPSSPETVAAMTAVAMAVKKTVMESGKDIPLGIQILAGCNKEALGVAKVAGLDFIRAEGFVFGHVADEGYIDGCSADLLRYRRMIGADGIQVFTDIKKKHSAHAITADVSIEETAHAAHFFLSDGVIVTGTSTGHSADLDEVRRVKEALKGTGMPVIVGSGCTAENVHEYLAVADAVIVGSFFKFDGNWQNTVDLERVERFMKSVNEFRARQLKQEL